MNDVPRIRVCEPYSPPPAGRRFGSRMADRRMGIGYTLETEGGPVVGMGIAVEFPIVVVVPTVTPS